MHIKCILTQYHRKNKNKTKKQPLKYPAPKIIERERDIKIKKDRGGHIVT